MKIFIIGAGFTGIELARMLSLEGRSVVLVDSDAEKVRQASDQLDCTVLAAKGNDLKTLDAAGLSSAEAIIALTPDDELNMVICTLVGTVYPKIIKIARVRDYAYSGRNIPGIDYRLNPEIEAANAIMRAIDHGAVGNVVSLSADWVVTTFSVGAESPLVGRSLAEISSLEGWHYLVAFLSGSHGSVIPHGSIVINEGDRIGVLSHSDEVEKLVEFTRSVKDNFRSVAVFGADRVGSLLVSRLAEDAKRSFWARLLGDRSREIVVVDQNPVRTRELAEKYPNVRVVCGDITDESLVEEERLASVDLLVAASGNYERNLIQAAYMKTRGVKKCIALTERAAYGDVARKLGIDVAVPVRRALVDRILGCLYGRHVTSVHSVCRGKLEIVEGIIASGTLVAGRKLSDLPALDLSALVLLVGDKTSELTVPTAETVLASGLRVVALMPAGDLKMLRSFFGEF